MLAIIKNKVMNKFGCRAMEKNAILIKISNDLDKLTMRIEKIEASCDIEGLLKSIYELEVDNRLTMPLYLQELDELYKDTSRLRKAIYTYVNEEGMVKIARKNRKRDELLEKEIERRVYRKPVVLEDKSQE